MGHRRQPVAARVDIDDGLSGAQVKALIRGIESGMEHEPEKSSTGSTSCLSAGHRHSEREGPLTVGIWCPVPLVITRNLTTAYALDVPCSRLCGLLLYCVFRRSRHKLLREGSILAIATLPDYDGTFRLLCIRMAARYVYA